MSVCYYIDSTNKYAELLNIVQQPLSLQVYVDVYRYAGKTAHHLWEIEKKKYSTRKKKQCYSVWEELAEHKEFTDVARYFIQESHRVKAVETGITRWISFHRFNTLIARTYALIDYIENSNAVAYSLDSIAGQIGEQGLPQAS